MAIIAFTPGQPVMTPLGSGVVAYVRNSPPDFTTPQAVSVRLDSRRFSDPTYEGTIFPVDQVTLDPSNPGGPNASL